MINKTETPCAIRKKTSAPPMTVPATLPSPKNISILIDVTKQYGYALTLINGTVRRSRITHDELKEYEKTDTPLKQVITNFKSKALSITAFNELNKLEKKINAQHNNN